MGPPAKLPSFLGLAKEIVGVKVPWDPDYEKALDTYLGRAARDGVDVQTRARDILANDRGHNPIHEHLVGLFGSPERIRLVTTNFDPHFSAACGAVFGDCDIPQYFGPALPPGAGFRGIAYLHGALAQRHHDLVLTVEDFASAYMTDGWATRFLVRVFTDRTVLFVGYSVTDPLMRYLLHAIPPTDRWYGLWHEESEDPGPDHSIKRIAFSTSASGDRFGDLNDGLKRWHWYARASVADHDREVQSLLREGPPTSPLTADYLRARLETDEGRTTFWRNAKGTDWFRWVADEGFLDGLTDEDNEDPATTLWGRWCLDHFCEGEDPLLLRWLRGRALGLQAGFRLELHMHLVRSDPLPPTPVLRQILALLLHQRADHWHRGHDWEWLLEKLWKAGLTEEAFAVLRAGTQPQLRPLERLFMAFDTDDVGLRPLANRVRTIIDPSALSSFLDEFGQELARKYPKALLDLGLARLVEAYELLDLARGTDADVDWVSYGRTAIAPSNQDSMPDAVGVFVEMVRGVIDTWAKEDPENLVVFAQEYLADQRKLLQRLAIHALAQAISASPDDLLKKATTLGWPRDPWVRPELYELLSAHYGRASEEARVEFLEQIRQDEWWGKSFDEHGAHARFSLSRKLLRDAPDSPATRQLSVEEAAAHPEWGESDKDGYLSRVTAGVRGFAPSPIEASQLLEFSPDEALGKIHAEMESARGSELSYSLFGAVQQASKENPTWGVRLLLLTLGQPKDASVAEALLYALREKNPSTPEQAEVLATVAASGFCEGTERALGMVLNEWAADLDGGTDAETLGRFDAAADALYERSTGVSPGITDHGWTEAATNHPAGDAARVWWRVAEAQDWVGEQFVVSLDEAEKARWMRVGNDSADAGAYARPILGMATNRLVAGDTPWANAEILRLFDPIANEERAAQVWDGRLFQRRWSWTVVQGLKPFFAALFGRTKEMLPHRSDELGDWVALLATHPVESLITLEELHQFIDRCTPEARVAFARATPRHLESLSASGREAVWTTMLAPYWKDRRTNMPRSLEPGEVTNMISWLPTLPEVAQEVLEHLEGSPGEELEHADDLIRTWDEGDPFLESHLSECVQLVRFLAQRHSINPWMAAHAISVLRKALDHGAPCVGTKEAAGLLVPLATEAAELVDQLSETC